MTALELLRDAFQSLRRNHISVLAYLAGSVAILTAYRVPFRALADYLVEDPPPPWVAIVTLGANILLAAAMSALQALIFSQIGKEIDRPLWKCSGPRDALQRFFVPWFILNLLAMMLLNLEARAGQADNLEAMLLLKFGFLLLCVLFFPVGACVMHAGRLNWQEFPENLLPIVRVFPSMLFVFLLGGAQFICYFAISELLPAPLKDSLSLITLMDVIIAFLECLTFAAMWRVCMIYRDMAPEDTDYFNW